MKKFLPVLLGILAFFIFLSLQILFDKATKNEAAITTNASKYDYFQKQLINSKFQTITGKTIDLTINRPKIIILNFWATWCAPCFQEMPSLLKLKDQFEDNELLILTINTDDNLTKEDINVFESKIGMKLNLNIILDQKKYSQIFQVHTLPFTITFINDEIFEIHDEAKDFLNISYIEELKKRLVKLSEQK